MVSAADGSAPSVAVPVNQASAIAALGGPHHVPRQQLSPSGSALDGLRYDKYISASIA